jgi:hypothetical protein
MTSFIVIAMTTESLVAVGSSVVAVLSISFGFFLARSALDRTRDFDRVASRGVATHAVWRDSALVPTVASGILDAELEHEVRTAANRGFALVSGDAGINFFYLNMADVTSKRAFLERCAKVMSFPDYFGNNWDALSECIRDLEWLPPARRYVVVLDNLVAFAATAPEEYGVAVDIFASARAFWTELGVEFDFVPVNGPPRATLGRPAERAGGTPELTS